MGSQPCRLCGNQFQSERSDAKYCSPGCKQKAYRTRNAAPVTGKEPPPADTRNAAPVTARAKQREEKAKRIEEFSLRNRIRSELEEQYRTKAAQYRAECDANVAAYKAKLNDQAKWEREQRTEEVQRARQTIEAYRAKGLITPDEYALIRRCLHPDSRMGTEPETFNRAFDIFNNSKIKTLLVKEDKPPRKRPSKRSTGA